MGAVPQPVSHCRARPKQTIEKNLAGCVTRPRLVIKGAVLGIPALYKNTVNRPKRTFTINR
jgi:hypothetical protein